MLRRTDTDRGAARAALGLAADEVILVAIGFLQPNKGFDRAIRGFAEIGPVTKRVSLWWDRRGATTRQRSSRRAPPPGAADARRRIA